MYTFPTGISAMWNANSLILYSEHSFLRGWGETLLLYRCILDSIDRTRQWVYLYVPPPHQAGFDARSFYSEGYRWGARTRVETRVLLVSAAKWIYVSLLVHLPGDLAGHRYTRPEGRVQYESMLVNDPLEWMLEILVLYQVSMQDVRDKKI